MTWQEFLQYQYIGLMDLIIVPIFLIIIYFFSKGIQIKHIETKPYYRYYMKGLFVKLFGGMALCLVYAFYYKGGDTMNYYFDSTRFVNLFLSSPFDAIRITLLPTSPYKVAEIFWNANHEWTIFAFDHNAFFVNRLTWILCLFSFQSFLGQTMLLAWASYFAIWRLYESLVYEFPDLKKQFALAILFIPSVFFWGSGLLKDSITFAAVALFTSSFHQIFIQKRKIVLNLFFLALSTIIMIKIKPYIFFALLPGSLLWLVGTYTHKMNNKLVRGMMVPVLLVIALGSGFVFLANIGEVLGDYRVGSVLNKAVVTQQDLKDERYQGNSFDIGNFEPTLRGVLPKIPVAINACLFRPYIWEARNITMLISGLENLGILVFSLYLLIKLKVINLFRLMFRERILFFTLFFSLFFAFSVGLTTSNFGSLVRYKIPAIPFFVVSLFIINYTYEKNKKERKAEKELEEAAAE